MFLFFPSIYNREWFLGTIYFNFFFTFFFSLFFPQYIFPLVYFFQFCHLRGCNWRQEASQQACVFSHIEGETFPNQSRLIKYLFWRVQYLLGTYYIVKKVDTNIFFSFCIRLLEYEFWFGLGRIWIYIRPNQSGTAGYPTGLIRHCRISGPTLLLMLLGCYQEG